MEMSQEHKDALAEGRKQARAIKAYLSALGSRGPGRPVTREGIEGRLGRLAQKIAAEENPLRRVELVQVRIDLEKELAAIGDAENFDELEAGFIAHARDYSERKGISYTAWRQVGVPATTLRSAGVKETRLRT